ncbi:MAG: glycogen/starch/alpha-glucan phosphorylase [Gammaproteobacteria bacterium]|nr:glycogen/starch/alpha-glucan phosphorylase [Gammaproteobacteria bacterium]
MDAEAIQRSINERLTFTIGKDPYTAIDRDWLKALSFSVRDRLIERWMESQRSYYRTDAKRVYYLSLEFLIGRSLSNAMLNLGFRDATAEALKRIGLDLEELQALEHDAALGNGGLGRLAACILDSIASLNLPGVGYGIRYEYGMFRQHIADGQQMELPENWLAEGNPWEFPRPEVTYRVRFGGRVMEYHAADGRPMYHWIEGDEVLAMAYDTPVPGYKTTTTNNLRLWSARATEDFDLDCFNQGNYVKSVEQKNRSENLSKVLYPDDRSSENQELRLRQQYFFVSASLQDILRRFLQGHDDLKLLPKKVAIQLNDTHPAIAVPELMRLLMDEHLLEWQLAWKITTNTFSYTNHTLLPEALESWPKPLIRGLLPRHLEIILEINRRFLLQVGHQFPDDHELLRRLSIIDEQGDKRIRMAHLAIVGSHKVNGVSALHSKLLQKHTFADFHRLNPDKIINITNGVTQRRWLNEANPPLANLVTAAIGTGWTRHLDQLEKLVPLADDAGFRESFAATKRANKIHLSQLINHYLDIQCDPDSLFDVQVKRIHEYKRQLLNLLRIITLYNRLRANSSTETVPRTFIIGGKAAPGYAVAKQIIHLIHDVAAIIGNDPKSTGLIKLIFTPNYDVSTASDIIPAAEVSQQISTAGMEASGTGNMKLALNGAITMGTLDGANIEMRERIGEAHFFHFGLTTPEVAELKRQGYDPRHYYNQEPELKQAIDMIANGYFSPEEPDRYRPLINHLFNSGDPYLLMVDYRGYMACDLHLMAHFSKRDAWLKSAIINTAQMGYFSSDRTVNEYAKKIWDVLPIDTGGSPTLRP